MANNATRALTIVISALVDKLNQASGPDAAGPASTGMAGRLNSTETSIKVAGPQQGAQWRQAVIAELPAWQTKGSTAPFKSRHISSRTVSRLQEPQQSFLAMSGQRTAWQGSAARSTAPARNCPRQKLQQGLTSTLAGFTGTRR